MKPLGVGGYGKVYLAKKRKTGDLFAVKVLRKQDLINKNMVDRVFLERDILASSDNRYVSGEVVGWMTNFRVNDLFRFFLLCRHVVKLMYSFDSNEHLYLVMEFMVSTCVSLFPPLYLTTFAYVPCSLVVMWRRS
jgi:serine/threonine protein kinase